MTIKESKELNRLADNAGESDRDKFGYEIISELVEWGMLPDNEDVYGCSLSNILKDRDVYLIVEFLDKFSIPVCKQNIDDFLSLVIMDDYDCPCCGCEMRLVYSSSEEVGGDGYNNPFEYEIIEEKECPHCGKVLTEKYIS